VSVYGEAVYGDIGRGDAELRWDMSVLGNCILPNQCVGLGEEDRETE
jgi:hypothetical protein